MTPTRLALEIDAHAESMSTAAQRLTASLALRRTRRDGELAITTSDALAPLLLRAIARSSAAPRIRLLVSDDERELEAGTVDVALRPTGTPRRSLRGRRLGVLAVGVYSRSGARSADEGWVTASDELRQRASLRWLRRVPDGARVVASCDSLLRHPPLAVRRNYSPQGRCPARPPGSARPRAQSREERVAAGMMALPTSELRRKLEWSE